MKQAIKINREPARAPDFDRRSSNIAGQLVSVRKVPSLRALAGNRSVWTIDSPSGLGRKDIVRPNRLQWHE